VKVTQAVDTIAGASTEEMSAQVEEVTTAAQALSEMAIQMQELVNRFILA
jgi:methyl-accepting chemotaxis protein